MQEIQLLSPTKRPRIFVSVKCSGATAKPDSHGAGFDQEFRTVSIMKRFGWRLRSLRQERSQTQLELAAYLGIDRSFISDLERGKKAASLSYLETIAQGFDLTLAELMDGL